MLGGQRGAMPDIVLMTGGRWVDGLLRECCSGVLGFQVPGLTVSSQLHKAPVFRIPSMIAPRSTGTVPQKSHRGSLH